MAKDTKERILDAALEIFARDGYAGTNIKDIAQSVGIVKSALYKHFDSKEAIWNAVTDNIASYYDRNIGATNNTFVVPKTMDELSKLTLKMVDFTIHDKRIIQVRKVLMMEQFRNEKIRDTANDYFLFRNEQVFTGIFSQMMDNGIIKKCDPKLLAFIFTTPITSLIHLCDRDKKMENEAMNRLQEFINHFVSEYGV